MDLPHLARVSSGIAVVGFSGLSVIAGVNVVKPPNYGFNQTGAIAASGPHVWVANLNTVTEISSGDGSLVRVIRVGSREGESLRDCGGQYPRVGGL